MFSFRPIRSVSRPLTIGWAFAKVRAKAPSQGHFVSRQINCRNEMKHQRHFDPMTPRLRQVATILGMIDDLNRVAGHLDCDIAAQEIASPLLASLTSRRDRLRETLALLETRLADIRGFQG
jgi:hypothetical protein